MITHYFVILSVFFDLLEIKILLLICVYTHTHAMYVYVHICVYKSYKKSSLKEI